VAVEDNALADINTYEPSSYMLFYLAKSTKRLKRREKEARLATK
jgi:hypothetical protein